MGLFHNPRHQQDSRVQLAVKVIRFCSVCTDEGFDKLKYWYKASRRSVWACLEFPPFILFNYLSINILMRRRYKIRWISSVCVCYIMCSSESSHDVCNNGLIAMNTKSQPQDLPTLVSLFILVTHCGLFLTQLIKKGEEEEIVFTRKKATGHNW